MLEGLYTILDDARSRMKSNNSTKVHSHRNLPLKRIYPTRHFWRSRDINVQQIEVRDQVVEASVYGRLMSTRRVLSFTGESVVRIHPGTFYVFETVLSILFCRPSLCRTPLLLEHKALV